MKFFILFFVGLFFIMPKSFSQDVEAENPGHSISVEVGGRNFMVGFDIEYRLKQKHSLSAGMGIWAFGGAYGMYHYFIGTRKKKSFFELGAGSLIRLKTIEGESRFIFDLWLGYRYQKKNGLLFRIGFTPSYDPSGDEEGHFGSLLPLGISLGYSF